MNLFDLIFGGAQLVTLLATAWWFVRLQRPVAVRAPQVLYEVSLNDDYTGLVL